MGGRMKVDGKKIIIGGKELVEVGGVGVGGSFWSG